MYPIQHNSVVYPIQHNWDKRLIFHNWVWNNEIIAGSSFFPLCRPIEKRALGFRRYLYIYSRYYFRIHPTCTWLLRRLKSSALRSFKSLYLQGIFFFFQKTPYHTHLFHNTTSIALLLCIHLLVFLSKHLLGFKGFEISRVLLDSRV